MKKIILFIISNCLILNLFAFSGADAPDSEYFCFDALKDSSLDEWNSCTDQQKIFLALASNLFGSNGQSYTQLFPYPEAERKSDYEKTCADILKNSWDVTKASDIPVALDRLEPETKHSDPANMQAPYEMVCRLLDENPNLSMIEIALKSGLTPFQRQKLYFASFFRDLAGKNGIIAYDLGRKLNILRWAIGAGYITWDEAWETAEPIIEQITTCFKSWPDYMNSYILGRGLFSMQEAKENEEYLYQSIKAAEVVYESYWNLIPKGWFRNEEYKENPFCNLWLMENSFTDEYKVFDMEYTFFYRSDLTEASDEDMEFHQFLLKIHLRMWPEDPFYAIYKAAYLMKQNETVKEAYDYILQASANSLKWPENHWIYEEYRICEFLLAAYNSDYEHIIELYENVAFYKKPSSRNYEQQYYNAIYNVLKNSEPDESNLKRRDYALQYFEKLSLTRNINTNILSFLRNYGKSLPEYSDAEDAFEKATALYDNGDYENSFKLMKISSDLGSAQAANDLGGYYLNGIGTARNQELGFKAYSLAAERGNGLGAFNVGVCYQNGEYVQKDDVLAFSWFMKGAELGNSNSQYALGIAFRDGAGVEQNYEKAYEWYEKAAEQNSAEALNMLGYCNINGIGVEVNQEKGVEYYRKAVNLGLTISMVNLGLSYEKGLGVEQNISTAVVYYTKAAEAGNTDAMYEVARVYESQNDIPNHIQTAVYWYTKGAENNNAYSAMRLGDIYFYGEYEYKINYEKASQYYAIAYSKGYGPAWKQLGIMFHDGLGLNVNYKTSWQLLKASVQAGIEGASELLEKYGWTVDCEPDQNVIDD